MTIHGFFTLKKIFFLLTIFFVIVTVIIFDSMTIPTMKMQPEEYQIKPTQMPSTLLKVFHLDLKGGAPKLEFLRNVLPIIRQAGANAILIEYEDMFPFSGRLRNISAKNSYTMTQLHMFIEYAESLKMEVIPLVQTFGHLEYALKLEEFQNLRELENFPQEICPMKRRAVNLIKEMITQIMRIHDNARYVHIGCDEVRHLGVCSRCARVARINSKKIFAKHVTNIANYVKTNYPGVTVLIWDDMLRGWNYRDLEKSGLNTAVEIVVWVYGSNIFDIVPSRTWNIYRTAFPKIWAASAFKGAFGEREIIPNLNRHLENNLSWKRILHNNVTELKFRPDFFSGIFITGWSRYDHFAALCELLPVGIPSLLLNLLSFEENFENISVWLNILHCPNDFRSLEEIKGTLGKCSFPGSDLYEEMTKFAALKKRAEDAFRKADSSGWFSRYNVENNFTSPWRILEMLPNEGFAGERILKDFAMWKLSSMTTFYEYYDKYTINEWLEENVVPLEKRLKEMRNIFQKLIARKSWPRRPFR